VSALTVSPVDGDPRRFSETADPWRGQIEHFLACIETGAEPRDGTFAQARAALAVALAARRSLESGLPEAV
jgi:predicted dehydrogenase